MAELPGTPRSLWLSAGEPEPRPAFEGEREADVAVVGGGIVGAATALLLAERGVSVALLEARRIAGAVTGNSTAKVTALHQTPYSEITRKVGPDAAGAYAQANLDGVAMVASLVDRHTIDCALEIGPAFLYTEDEATTLEVEAEAEAARAAGLDVELTDQTDLPFPVVAAARLDDQIGLDSAALTRGLADAAEAAGAVLHEHSRVRSIDHGDPCRLELENGAVLRAERAVLATQMPLLDRGLFFARLRPQASYAVAAPAEHAPLGMYLGIGGATRSVRSTPGPGGSRRLIVGGEGHKVGQGDGAAAYQRLAAWLGERFEAGSVEHRWSAHDLMSPDKLPMIGELAPFAGRILTATGFSKWGLAIGVAAAAMLTGELVGEPDARREAFDTRRLNLRAALPELVKENADVGMRFFAGRLKRDSGGPLAPGEGRVAGDGPRQIAECRDFDGNLHRLSARCPHLGCIVTWNGGDATWDCPCHGSRFEADGSVRNGPATAPLEPAG